jgi:hypothetical protein
MSDDSILTERLRKLADIAGDESGAETIVLDEMDLMATTEFRRLVDPACDLPDAIEANLQDDESE